MSPSLATIREANASRLRAHSHPLIAVFTGGTSGIGEYTLRTYAAHTSKGNGARIYLVGRSAEAAKTISDDLAHLANVQIRFIQANDLSLIKEVDRCSNEVARLIQEDHNNQGSAQSTPHIDLLVMSHADFWLGPRRETIEGLDKLFSLLSYSRIRFAQNFLPLLTATPLASARVISIFAAGVEGTSSKIFQPEDLSLRDPKKFAYFTMRNHAVLLKQIAFEQFAAQSSNVAFVHVFPGLVLTPGFERNPMPLWFRVLWKILAPLAKLTFIKRGDIGDWMLGLTSEKYGRGEKQAGDVAVATTGAAGGGAYSAKFDGTIYDKVALYDELRKNGFKEKAWTHTLSAFKSIQEDGVFKA